MIIAVQNTTDIIFILLDSSISNILQTISTNNQPQKYLEKHIFLLFSIKKTSIFDKTERNIKYINDKTERYVYFYECITCTLIKLPVRTFLKDERTGSCLYYHQITPPQLCPK